MGAVGTVLDLVPIHREMGMCGHPVTRSTVGTVCTELDPVQIQRVMGYVWAQLVQWVQ